MGRSRAYWAALAAVVVAGCATVLGFEETTVRTDSPDGAAPDGALPDANVTPDGQVTDAGASALTVKPDPTLIQRGQTVDVEITLVRGARTGAVPFSVTGLPSGVTASGDTQVRDGADKATLRLSAAASAALGSSVVTVDAGADVGATRFTVTVSAAPGTLDETFDRDGIAADGTRGNASTFFAVIPQADGKVVAGGFASLGGALPPSGWLLRRFTAAGGADAAFNAAVSGLPPDGALQGLTFDAAGNVLCVGTAKPTAASAISQLTVMRFKSTGLLDTTFATGGTFRMPNAAATLGSRGFGVVVQPSGAIVVVGSRQEAASESGLMIRLSSAGLLDGAFAGGGVLVPSARLVGVGVEAGGALVAGGADLAANTFLFVKRGVDGAVDPAFGVGGISRFGAGSRGNGFARLADGSLAVVGEGTAANQFRAGRAAATGAQVFAGIVHSLPGATYQGVTSGVSGTIVAAGHANGGLNGAAVVDRLHGDGGLDPSFGDGGIALFGDPASPDTFKISLFGLAAQTDGRILAGGNASNAGAVVLRIWP